MRNIHILLFFGLFLTLLVLGSCSQDNAEEVGPVTVTLGYNSFLSDTFTDAPAPIDVIRQSLAAKYPDIQLEYFTMPQDLLESLVIWMTSEDTTVDIFGMDVPWVTQFGRAGWAVPLNDKVQNLEENLYGSGLETFSYEGNQLAVPFWGGVAGLFYRTDLLEEYGFSPPGSVDEMVRIIETIRADRPELSGLLWPGQREESLNMFYATLLYAFGGEYTAEDGSYALDSPESIQAIQFMNETLANSLSPREVPGWTRLESRQQFVDGQGIFSWDNHDIVTWLDDPTRSKVAGKWGLMPFPAQPNGRSVAITGGFGFAMNPFSPNQEAAAKVLEVIAGPEVQKGFALAWGPVQHSRGLYDDPQVRQYNPNVDLLVPLLERSLNRPPSTNYALLSDSMLQELNSSINGQISPEVAAANIQRRATEIDRR
ncbi:MAG: extracellular solute-binding protein [Spirochaetales bacterium]|nr:extracellular solute-binding protein [Spirochaetales bacterium]